MTAWLKDIPVLFAIRYAYKQTLLVVCRAFLSVLALLEDRVPNYQQVGRVWAKVLYMEKLFGSLFLAGGNLKELLQTTLNRAWMDHYTRVQLDARSPEVKSPSVTVQEALWCLLFTSQSTNHLPCPFT